jgi:hypothetical protein
LEEQMRQFRREHMRRATLGVKWAMGSLHKEPWFLQPKGRFIVEMWDTETGEVLADFEQENVITRDAGILAASLFKGDAVNPNGLTMLGVGTGATGDPLNPDAPTSGQRKLNAEIERKPFAETVYRNSAGVAVSIKTHVVDFTTIFSEAEAVGPLTEMGLMSTVSSNPAPAFWAPINNGPANYDPTIDVDGKDLMVNYLTFGAITKPATAILKITWRLTF